MSEEIKVQVAEIKRDVKHIIEHNKQQDKEKEKAEEEHKKSHDKLVEIAEGQEKRIRKIENMQYYIMGGCALLLIIGWFTLEGLFGKLSQPLIEEVDTIDERVSSLEQQCEIYMEEYRNNLR